MTNTNTTGRTTKLLAGATLAIVLLAGTWNLLTGAQARSPQASKPQVSNAKLAPELVGKQWLNTPNGEPITLAARHGKVTVVEFWTFSCVNCQANLPAYSRWHKDLAAQGVEVIGVHTPETAYERDPKNVAHFVQEHGITYPVLLDENEQNWKRWNQQYWPAVYVVDGDGRIRGHWDGELHETEAQVVALIKTLVQESQKPKAANAAATDNAVHKLTAQEWAATAKGGKVEKITKTDAEWRTILTPAQYDVLRQHGTERAFSGSYESEGTGIYHCAGCGLPVYMSDTQFDSGTGWPSFFRAIPGHVTEITDNSYGMTRTEVVCARCGGHLGHVFNDGPAPTGLRYCMNAVAMKFEKAEVEKDKK